MSCEEPKPVYLPHTKRGLNSAISKGDGYSIGIDWTQAFPSTFDTQIAYNIYYSSVFKDVFAEGPKLVSFSPQVFAGTLVEFTPGDTYYFAVRAMEYDQTWFDLSLLPDGPAGFKVYPQAMLLSNVTIGTSSIQISDITDFPGKGIVQIGYELVRYTSKDVPSNALLGLTRGFLNTDARIHNTDGYDGLVAHEPPFVKFWNGYEDMNLVVMQETAAFEYPNYPRTNADGYREQTKDNLTTDLSGSDASQQNFVRYDYVGYHRTDPLSLLRGDCIGTYYGGEQYCADGYGVGFQVRGVPFSSENNRRQEILLETIGESVVLVRRLWTGKTCNCYDPSNENPNLRCPTCFGTGFVTGYNQFFNPRRSDGRILIRFSPVEDDLKLEDDGLESTFLPEAWTMVYPTVKDRDFIIRFNEDGTEEYRYKILNVTRNKLLESMSGSQKMRMQRMRRTDPIYQWRAIRSTATMPQTITTNIGMVSGPGGILPHMHNLVVNEGIVSVLQINETTDISQGHNHPIINGVVQPVLGHTHTIILP